jgi:hypothetical protein
MRTRTIRNALIVAPVSVLRSWEKEANRVLRQCLDHVSIKVVSSDQSNRTYAIGDALDWCVNRNVIGDIKCPGKELTPVSFAA